MGRRSSSQCTSVDTQFPSVAPDLLVPDLRFPTQYIDSVKVNPLLPKWISVGSHRSGTGFVTKRTIYVQLRSPVLLFDNVTEFVHRNLTERKWTEI